VLSAVAASLRRLVSFRTLRARLTALACLATLPAFIFVFYVAAKERKAVLHRIEAESRYVADLASREHAHQVLGASRLLDRLASLPSSDGVSRNLPQVLPTILKGFPQFANLGLLGLDGRITFSSVPPHHKVNMASLPVFQQALTSNDVVVGSYLVGLIVERPILLIAKAVRDRHGAPTQVLFAALDLAWLGELAQQAGLPSDNALFIVDRHGTVLASSVGNALSRGRSNAIIGFDRLIRRPNVMTRCETPDGTPRLAVATPLKGIRDVWVVVGPPEAGSYSAADNIFYRDLVVLAMLAILAVASSLAATEFSVLGDIRKLAAATYRFGKGDLDARVPVPRPYGEIRDVTTTFNAMADSLESRHHEAIRAQEQLRALSDRLQTARETEAARISQELHDELGQELSVLRLEVERLRRKVVNPQQGQPQELTPLIEELGERIDATVRSVRRIASELRPGVLDRLGLLAGIEWLLNELERRTGIAASLTAGGIGDKVDADVSTAVFRITQEALTNVVRHAKASAIDVELFGTADAITLCIADNGEGFDAAAERRAPSLGLFGMKERARGVGGALEINGIPGGGTTIRVVIPQTSTGPCFDDESEATRSCT
jgi:signal transduction histidine kinase